MLVAGVSVGDHTLMVAALVVIIVCGVVWLMLHVPRR